MNAIDIVRQMVSNGQVSQEVAEKYFPELKERDGGKIRERLIAFLSQCKAVYGDSFKQFELNIDEALDWLKKQGEQTSPILSNTSNIGNNWKEEQFEKNRLKHCNSITNEQAELEQEFIDQHLDKHQRIPTFLDAIEYGMRLREQQMMARAVDGEVGYWNLRGLSVNAKLPRSVNEGDKVKVIVIKKC